MLVSITSGCAHTKPIGQSFVALGALIVGLGTLDAAGVLGSKCTHTRTPEGEPLDSCSGNSVAPQPVNVVGIALGAALIGGGIALWTTDSQSTPNQQPPNTISYVPTQRAASMLQPPQP
jgi:hypothetical protein